MRNHLFSLTAIVCIITEILALSSGAQMLSIDSDLGRHLVLGNYMLDHRTVPTRNLLSHTLPDASRPPYEWLSQILFAVFDRLLGLDGVILLTAIIISVTIAVVFHQSVRASNSPLIALAVTLLAVSATSIHWLPRPHIVTFLLLPLWIAQLEKKRKHNSAPLYIFPLLMLLWANLHGGFIFGFLALAAYFGGWLWDYLRGRAEIQNGKEFTLIGVTSLGASILTPDLWRNWEAVLNNRSSFILSRTAETTPPQLTNSSAAPFLILLILTAIFSLINRKNISAAHIFLLGGLAVMALMMARNIPLFAIACTPFLAEWISVKANQASAWQKFDARFVNLSTSKHIVLFPLLISLTTVAFFINKHSKGIMIYQFDPRVFPVQATDWLEKNPPTGKMFNDFNWGGYLLYRLWPRELVFVDSQSDFYGEPLLRDYETMMVAGHNWLALLEQHQINWVIIPANAPLALQLKQESNWETLYEDQIAVILQQK